MVVATAIASVSAPIFGLGEAVAQSVPRETDASPLSLEQAVTRAMSAGPAAQAKFYDCGHEMNRAAMDDRVGWIVERLRKE